MSDLIIYGSGGHGAVVAEVAVSAGFRVVGFVDDNVDRFGSEVLGWPVLGGSEDVPDGASVVLAVGDNSMRAKLLSLARSRGWRLPVTVHPGAAVSRSAWLDEGSVVMANSVINARARIGSACILNTACSVDHDCEVGEVVHVAPGSRLGGGVIVDVGSLIGIGSSVRPGVHVGSWCLIGAGSVVVSDVPEGVTTYGNPARIKS